MDKMEEKFSLYHGKNVSILEYQVVKLVEDYDNGYAVFLTRQMAVKAGFMCTDEVMIATAASELSTNIIRYAGQGEIIISIIKDLNYEKKGIEVYASDSGHGIRDVKLAMKEKYSSLPNSLGLGLPSVKRIMDEFYIESLLERGTRVIARKWIR
ncbi:anti-sigma regulatory factor [Clostridium sp. JS66]|uniref:anti-sigma regulatory factor n=1 Tax=Clostridium sp. JS66 TaxID=3064705 RepID=UPI00298E6444|nr:anti-sigma regulatory factor [Clostridium sp. JS66]WPC44325.1 anti-sigma regulatory factor [Clostridium sp. JS66]